MKAGRPGAPASRGREAAARTRYSPWLVANLHIERALHDRPGAPPSWDNVLYGSAGLGYVDARHQLLRGVVTIAPSDEESVIARERTRASGLAIALWFFFVLVFDLLLLGGLVATGGSYGGEAFAYLLLLNPADVFRILNVFSLEDVRTLYGLASIVPPALARPWLLGLVMLAWIVLPLTLARWRFRT